MLLAFLIETFSVGPDKFVRLVIFGKDSKICQALKTREFTTSQEVVFFYLKEIANGALKKINFDITPCVSGPKVPISLSNRVTCVPKIFSEVFNLDITDRSKPASFLELVLD